MGKFLSKVFNSKQQVVTINRFGHESQTTPKPYTDTATTGRRAGNTVTLVLLGMSGTGKSASGNTILGKKHFTSRPSSKPVTTECQAGETVRNGVNVHVIDTPDIFDDEIQPSVRDKHVRRCKQLCQSEFCVFVLVIHVSRFTDGERNILMKLEKAFGSKVNEQTVILFTRGGDLQQSGVRFEEFLHSCQTGLKEIVERCGRRCVLFENNETSSDQVKKLMETVNNVIQDQQK